MKRDLLISQTTRLYAMLGVDFNWMTDPEAPTATAAQQDDPADNPSQHGSDSSSSTDSISSKLSMYMTPTASSKGPAALLPGTPLTPQLIAASQAVL